MLHTDMLHLQHFAVSRYAGHAFYFPSRLPRLVKGFSSLGKGKEIMSTAKTQISDSKTITSLNMFCVV